MPFELISSELKINFGIDNLSGVELYYCATIIIKSYGFGGQSRFSNFPVYEK